MSQIKNMLYLGALVALAGIGVQRAAADTPSLQDFTVATDGGVNFYDPGSGAPGLDLSGYSTVTGLGTITFTDTTVGSDSFALWWDEEVGTDYFNEYGTAVGTLSDPNETWEIGDNYGSTIYSDSGYDALLDTNYLPGTTSNLSTTCSGPSCNGDATTALGYNYTVGTGEEEVITLSVSQTAPGGGFYLQQTNPQVDCTPQGLDCSTGNVYFSLSAEEEPVNSGPPSATPEPSTWLLMLSGLLIPAWRMRRRIAVKSLGRLAALLVVAAVALSATARAQQVLTVPWDPTNPAAPHTAYTGAKIILGAVFNGAISGHSYTYSWNFGDGSAATTPAAVTGGQGTPSFNDISASHVYSGASPGVTTWTATVTVSDKTAAVQYNGNYLVIWENNTLQSRVNVAIDWGLWYLHEDMSHPGSTTISPGTTGTWVSSCAPGYGSNPGSCGNGYGSLDATNVQAFEVNGHMGSGPATDPYTADVAEGLTDMLNYLQRQAVASNSYTYNPATANFGCSDGTAPTSTLLASPHFYCDSSATPVYYEQPPVVSVASTSCTTPPCTVTFDGNSNGYAVYSNGNYGYENGMFVDALVASNTPAATGNMSWGSETYKDLVQDMVDMAGYCQYPNDQDVSTGYTRGSGNHQGGGWWYSYECQAGGDNSTSQWTSIGLIAAQRGFGITIPQIIPDMNNMWVTASQNVQATDNWTSPHSGPPPNSPVEADSDNVLYGGFGYNGSLYYSNAWGPWAVTPSGMVQMSLDGIGRTNNTAFGASSNDPDQRFNWAESLYADNFCNPVTGTYGSVYYSPRTYTYGMFSFTKSMLLHNPNGAFTPIQYLRTMTPNVFTSTNPSTPANTLDWYGAVGPEDGGTDSCDGIAQTLLDRQYATGYWWGSDYEYPQTSYETAWALIMLQKSVFVTCVNNLAGLGTASGTAAARIDLSWTGIPSASGYEVLRGTTSGGPYSPVGNSTSIVYSDRAGLSNGNTYYYVLQPLNANGGSLCQSNQATITIPAGGRTR